MGAETITFAIAGIASAALGAAATFSQNFAAHYVQKSPKGWIWRKILGEERAVIAMKRVFGPIAMVLGVIMVGVALISGSPAS